MEDAMSLDHSLIIMFLWLPFGFGDAGWFARPEALQGRRHTAVCFVFDLGWHDFGAPIK
jgi:hypothetical protein